LEGDYHFNFEIQYPTMTIAKPSNIFQFGDAIDSDQVDVYYTHPYTSSERGTNERHNGLIRRFIPKGKSIDDIDETLIAYVEKWCNTLPRKILGYRSPNDVYIEELRSIA
jgi:IS30 family transposase